MTGTPVRGGPAGVCCPAAAFCDWMLAYFISEHDELLGDVHLVHRVRSMMQ